MSFERSSHRGARSSAARNDTRPTLGPGKQTLTAQLDAAIQRRAAAQAPDVDVHTAAAHGTSGGATALPHQGQIQQSFGRHDIGQIKAHVGGSAAEGAAAMGASAFAMGEHVAFAGAPDLHTAAHEAAHVVQQRAGVQLKGGVGEVGDPYERHADAVADLVVQGKSSEALLDHYAGQNAGQNAGHSAGPAPTSGGPVQRYAFINGQQVKKTDKMVSGGLVDFVTDVAVRDYYTEEEFKNHAAGKTDYLGNLRDKTNTWLRFSPTGLNVLGEMHQTDSSLEPVLAAINGKKFISEGISSDAFTPGSHLGASYEAHNADRFKRMGIENEKDKKKFGAESLLPKIGFALGRMIPYLNTRSAPPPDTNIHGLTKGTYEGELYLSYLKMGWAHAIDLKAEVASKRAAKQPVPPKLDALVAFVIANDAVLDPFITGLPLHGWLGDALVLPGKAALLGPLAGFARAMMDALTEVAIDDPTSRMDAAKKKKFAGATSDKEKVDEFSEWRDFRFEDKMKDAASHGVRYAGVGWAHMDHLRKLKTPTPDTQIYDMNGDDIIKFEEHTEALSKVAVKQ